MTGEVKKRAREEQTGTGREKPRGKNWAKLCAAVSAQSRWMDLLEEKHLGSVLFLPLLNK